MKRQKLVVLGATGSIGASTLDVVARHPQRFEILALSAQNNVGKLAEQCAIFRPRYAVVGRGDSASRLHELLGGSLPGLQILAGPDALEHVAGLPEADAVVAAIVGAAGLRPALAAARAGKKILLANKEALVSAGSIFIEEIKRSGATLLPVDSEHNAIYQSLPHDYSSNFEEKGIRRILLTASGGPFRTLSREALDRVTPTEACAHPNWLMGRKISVDSASMMNKGLEVIEAHWLFGAPASRIEVVVHPQSVIHSLVEYADGSVLAQLGNPDMRTPIAHALAYPERIDAGVPPLDLFRIGSLDFEAPDFSRFPCLGLAYKALEAGGNAPAVLNAANEVAVDAFLAGTLPFTRIPLLIEQALSAIPWARMATLEDVLAADASARALARKRLVETCS